MHEASSREMYGEMKKSTAMEVFGAMLESIKGIETICKELEKLDANEFVETLRIAFSVESTRARKLNDQVITFLTITGLTRALGRPPTVDEIAEVTRLSRSKVWRLLGGKEGEGFRQLLKIEGTSFKELRFRKEDKGKDVIFHRKQVGRSKIEYTGGSLKLYFSTRMHPIETLNEIPMLPSERKELMGYLSESYFNDLIKEIIIDILKSSVIFGLLFQQQEIRKTIYKYCKPIGEHILAMAEKERGKQEYIPLDVRVFYSFDWLLYPPPEIFEWLQNSSEYLAKAEEVIKEMPNDLIVKALIEKSWNKEVEDETYIDAMGGPYLHCSICKCETPVDTSEKEFKCEICGSVWKIAN